MMRKLRGSYSLIIFFRLFHLLTVETDVGTKIVLNEKDVLLKECCGKSGSQNEMIHSLICPKVPQQGNYRHFRLPNLISWDS
jgi:hypothetical protein